MKEETNNLPGIAMALFRCICIFLMAAMFWGVPMRAHAAEAVKTMGGAGKTLIPVGRTAGIKLFADGVMVIGLSEVIGETGTACPAKACGLKEGDIITRVNGAEVQSAEQLRDALQQTNGSRMSLQVLRGEQKMELKATAAVGVEDGCYRLGAWTRDSMAGIGTITFYDPESGVFGALGHGINDIDTFMLIPLASGSIMGSSVANVAKGQAGTPGELQGKFDLTKDLGALYANTDCGIFGKTENDSYFMGQNPVPAAGRTAAKVGKATILSNVAGDAVCEYEIEITKVYRGFSDSGRNLMIQVTDPKLLETTGGIVQGMSGSPILQDGKLVGAVTHVLVENPQKGYGIFIEKMMEESKGNETKMAS
jgi:stage IV sporulation protein B